MKVDSNRTHLVFFQAHALRKMTPDELLKFMHKVKKIKETGCWEWQGYRHRNYGTHHIDNDSCWTHRLAYVHFIGPIPPRHVIDHVCENKCCCNPEHLKAVTLSINNLLWWWRWRDKHNLRLPFLKTLVLLIMLLNPMVSDAFGEQWTEGDTKREAVYLFLHLLDWGTTLDIDGKQYHENNLILGKRPSRGEVNRYFLATGIAHILISKSLPKKWRVPFQHITIIIESGCVIIISL